MAINPLNLQLSVPRSPELSSIQQQSMQRPITEQTMLEANASKQAEEQRSTTNVVNETEKSLIRDKESNNPHEKNKKGNKGEHSNQEGLDNQSDESKHPYKGHRLDIRL